MKGFINVSILYLYWFLYLYLSLYLYLRLYSSSPSDQLASVPGEWRLVHICYKLSICRCCFSSAPGHFGRRTARPGHIMISQRGPTTGAHHTSPFWAISISASQWIHSSFLWTKPPPPDPEQRISQAVESCPWARRDTPSPFLQRQPLSEYLCNIKQELEYIYQIQSRCWQNCKSSTISNHFIKVHISH